MNRHRQHASRTSIASRERQHHGHGQEPSAHPKRDPAARDGNRRDRAASGVDEHSIRNEHGDDKVDRTHDNGHPRQMGESENRDEGRFGEGEQGPSSNQN